MKGLTLFSYTEAPRVPYPQLKRHEMNIRTACFLLLLASGFACASTPNSGPIIYDKPGFLVHLDIAKVISNTDVSEETGIVSSKLDYLDHAGREHVMDYEVEGSDSAPQN